MFSIKFCNKASFNLYHRLIEAYVRKVLFQIPIFPKKGQIYNIYENNKNLEITQVRIFRIMI